MDEIDELVQIYKESHLEYDMFLAGIGSVPDTVHSAISLPIHCRL